MRPSDCRPLSCAAKVAVLLAVAIACAPSPPAGAGVNRWTTLGPEGGPIDRLSVAPSDPSRVYANSTRLFRSSNGGRTWEITAWRGEPALGELAVDATDPSRLYSFGQSALFLSTDAGDSWTPIGSDLPSASYGSVVASDAHDPEFLLTLIEGQLYRSRDRGDSWDAVSADGAPTNALVSVQIDPFVAGRVLALAQTGSVYLSTNQGESWTQTQGLPIQGSNLSALVFDPRRLGTVLARGAGLYLSRDGGQTWLEVFAPDNATSRRFVSLTMTGDASTLVLWSPHYNYGPNELWRAIDGGAVWQQLPDLVPEPGEELLGTAIAGSSAGLLATTGRGIYRSEDEGLSWVASDSGRISSIVNDLSLDRQNSDNIFGVSALTVEGGESPRFLVSSDRGTSWREQRLLTSTAMSSLYDLKVDPTDSSRLWAGGRTTGGFAAPVLLSSADRGENWDFRAAPQGCLRFLELVIDPLDSRRVYWVTTLWVTGHCPSPPTCSTFRSDDSGANWSCVGYEHFPKVSPSRFRAGEVLKVSRAGIFLSDDFGENWDQVALPPEVPGDEGSEQGRASFVDVEWATASIAYATNLGAGLFASVDGGHSWTAASGPPEDLVYPWLTELAVDPFHPERIFALAKPDGDDYYSVIVVTSGDGGETWQEISEGIDGSYLSNLELDPTTPNRLYVSALGRGILAYDYQQPEPCAPSATALCITDGRFKIESLWRDFAGRSGVGHARPLAADSGTFWFFDPDNLELFVKEIDGVSFNNAYWTFYGALSNVEFTVLATDTATGAQHGYFNPIGTFASRGDIESFPQEEGFALPSSAATAPVPWVHPRAAPLRSANACVPNATTLCLADGRFAASVSWHDFAGRSGVGTPIVLTPDTGSFWFFDAGIHELAVKVIDGRGTNNAWWVFYGSLSNVEFELTVVDTETGDVWARSNPSGTFASGGDIEAFPQSLP